MDASNFKSINLKNVDEEKLKAIIGHNLKSLDRILDYNYKNNIRLFRITSDLIAFGSRSGVYNFSWCQEFSEDFKNLRAKIRKTGIRVSFHPGQYTILNSPREEVVLRSVEDLSYHSKLLDLLTEDSSHKMVVHIGGVYGDKKSAIDRFIFNFDKLDQAIKDRLVIENDDRSYNIEDVLEIGSKIGIPVVFDSLHHRINSPKTYREDRFWLEECRRTWKKSDGRQKIHYSQQSLGARPGSHSKTIDLDIFKDYYGKIAGKDIDIMLEVKDKNISCIKCINSLREDGKMVYLEREWARYKYSVLDRDQKIYLAIRQLLKDKSSYPVDKFYGFIGEALAKIHQVICMKMLSYISGVI